MSHYDVPWKDCRTCIYRKKLGDLINIEMCYNTTNISEKGILPYCEDMNDGDCHYYKKNNIINRFKKKHGICL